jgi:hypothetical protein
MEGARTALELPDFSLRAKQELRFAFEGFELTMKSLSLLSC